MCAVAAGPTPARGHEGHELPATGATVQGNRILLAAGAAKAIGLATATVGLKDLERSVTANAPIEVPWRQHAFASTLVKGRIQSILAKPGDTVSAGQELLRIDGVEIEAMQLELLQFEAERALAARVARQREKLAATGATSQKRLWEALAAERERMVQVAIAARKLRSLGFSQESLDKIVKTGRPAKTVSIASPVRGVVSQAEVRVGQTVEPWQHLYEIVDLSSLWAHGQVLETDMMSVREGMPVEMTCDALPGKTFASRIEHVGIQVDPESRSIHVHVPLDNAAGLLRPGMFGRLRITVADVKQAVVCPVEAITHRNGRDYVLLHERDGVYVRTPVSLGMRSGGWVEVIDGLFPGDPVVVTGRHELSSLFVGGESTQKATPRKVSDANTQDKQGPSAAPASSASAKSALAMATIELPTTGKSFAGANAQGRIATVHVEHGQLVRTGEVLAEIESLALRDLQLDLLLARTRLELAEQSLARFRTLDEQGAVADRELWQLQTQIETLKNAVSSLGQKLAQLGLTTEEIDRIKKIDVTSIASSEEIATTLKVRAARDGRITAFDLAIGQVVRPQDPLFEIHDLTKVWAQGYVFAPDAAGVRIGQNVRVGIAADPGFSKRGVVSRIAPELSGGIRALKVWAELENPDGRLKEGMLATMVLERPAEQRK